MPLPPRDTDLEGEVGAGGGGMAILLGILPRAVPIPVVGARGLGVANGERMGDDKERGTAPGGAILLSGVALMVLSCLAVIPAYLDARVPGVGVLIAAGVAGSAFLVSARRRAAFAAGVSVTEDGVMRPLLAGVTRPLDGVIRPLLKLDRVLVVLLNEVEGVIRPLCDASRRPLTDGGLWTAPGPTVGAESLVVATKTPQLGGQEKYCFLGH